MDNLEIVDILGRAHENAYLASEYNKTTPKTIRASNAGKPLLELVLSDIVYPNLPLKTHDGVNTPKKVAHSMRIALGYVYETAVQKVLEIDYPGYEVTKDVELTYKSIKGHADFVAVDHANKKVTVIECKALGTYGVRDTQENKVYIDNWGYYTQLAIYMAAISRELVGYTVEGVWYVWCKKTETSVVVEFPGGLVEAIQVAEEAEEKAQHYLRVKEYLELRMYRDAANYLLENTEDIAGKGKAKAGYFYARSGFHYSPLAKLLLTEEGTLKDEEEIETPLILLMMAGAGNQAAVLSLVTEFGVDFLTTPQLSASILV